MSVKYNRTIRTGNYYKCCNLVSQKVQTKFSPNTFLQFAKNPNNLTFNIFLFTYFFEVFHKYDILNQTNIQIIRTEYKMSPIKLRIYIRTTSNFGDIKKD